MENVGCLFISVETFVASIGTENTFVLSSFSGINYVSIAVETRASKPLPNNGQFILLNYSGFQLSCHSIV
jgi:hypothetical protein